MVIDMHCSALIDQLTLNSVEMPNGLKLSEDMINSIHGASTPIHMHNRVVRVMHGLSEAITKLGHKFYMSPCWWKRIGFVLRIAAFCHNRKVQAIFTQPIFMLALIISG